MDWHAWHDNYDRADSALARRLRVVQEKIQSALDGRPPGPVRVISMCAGQGRDLLEVLAGHPRREDVKARLVELDRRNTAIAEDLVKAAGLDQVDVVTGDAARTDHYRGLVPVDIAVICGLFGNITDEDIERTIDTCTRLCATGGTVVWTRGRFAPDLVPQICAWFAERDFELEWLSEPDAGFGVGVHRFTGEPRPLEPGTRMFTFVGQDALRNAAQ
jgi:microcompartment protein CcmK/EutM